MIVDIEKYKQIALQELSPIRTVDEKTEAHSNFLLTAQRSLASEKLPEGFLIFFLFHNLLKFKNLGRFEKIAWSFPIDYKGRAFLIEHRKFGVGIFVQDAKIDEKDAEEIVKKINEATNHIKPFYDYLAEEAVNASKINIINHNQDLFNRYKYFLLLYKREFNKYTKNKDKFKVKEKKLKEGTMRMYTDLGYQYNKNANWIAISCIEAFFSWTEHLFIHLAVVGENLSDGKIISNLIVDEWKNKFKKAITDDSKKANTFYNELLIVRQQLRNFVAHGAFGKNGNPFMFHSEVGAVPVLMDYKKQKNRFSLHGYLTFKEDEVIKLIEDFIVYLSSSKLAPAMYYTQDCGLPTILTYAANGTYKKVTIDMKNIKEFSDMLSREIDNATNMDW